MTIDKNDLRELLAEIFEERARIDANTHGDHHLWIQERIECEKARKQMFWEISKAVAQWSVIGIIGAALYWIQNGHWPHYGG